MDEQSNIGNTDWHQRHAMRAAIDQLATQLVDRILASDDAISTFVTLGHECEAMRVAHHGTKLGLVYTLSIIGFEAIVTAMDDRVDLVKSEGQA